LPQRILSISGLRGIIGDGLDPDYITTFASALSTMWQGGTVILSRDGRSSGNWIKHSLLGSLIAGGCRVLDADICSTPTCGVLVDHYQAAGGIQVTASHNPIEWNGLKPFSPKGSIFDATLGEKLIRCFESKEFHYAGWDGLGVVETLSDPSAPHMERIFNLIDIDSIKQAGLNVVLDCNHGSGAILGPRLLESLGCHVTVLGGKPDGQFEHTPEPVAENLTGLCDVIRDRDADVGFAQDPDADRLAIVDNTGRYIGEELTLALCADHVLKDRRGPIVVNGSTSRVTADIAKKYDCEFYRSDVGEAHVVAKMKDVAAVLGGEGNGGVIEPQVGFVRDSFVSMAYLLEGLSQQPERRLSDWVDHLPQYTIVKDKISCPRDRVETASDALAKHFQDAEQSRGDGLRLDWNDRWVQIRASNTEPIIRIIAEAPNSTDAKTLCEAARQIALNSI